MGLSRTSKSLTLTCFIALAIIHPTSAQNSSKNFVDAHNLLRAQVGVGPVSWDVGVAGYALNYTNQKDGNCDLVHSAGPYGENIATGSSDLTGVDAVNLWATEKAFYDYNSNSCADGRRCGHYTQMVWRNTVRIGCARVQCDNGWWLIICNYDPPGNFIGLRPTDPIVFPSLQLLCGS